MALKKVSAPAASAENTEVAEKAPKEKKPRKVRPEFQVPPECVNEEGKLISIPETFDSAAVGKFRGWKKSEFADKATFFEYRAVLVEARMSRMAKLAERLRKDAAAERAGGGESAKKLRKLQKMREAAAALEAELAAEGIRV